MSKSKPPFHFRVDDPVFKTRPLFVIGCKESELAAFLESKYNVDYPVDIDDVDNLGTVLTFNAKDVPHWVVWSRHYPTTAEGVGHLAHEIVHLVFDIFDDRCVVTQVHLQDGGRGDEPFAYLYEFFISEALKKVRAR